MFHLLTSCTYVVQLLSKELLVLASWEVGLWGMVSLDRGLVRLRTLLLQSLTLHKHSWALFTNESYGEPILAHVQTMHSSMLE